MHQLDVGRRRSDVPPAERTELEVSVARSGESKQPQQQRTAQQQLGVHLHWTRHYTQFSVVAVVTLAYRSGVVVIATGLHCSRPVITDNSAQDDDDHTYI